jgi:hypothetical protein
MVILHLIPAILVSRGLYKAALAQKTHKKCLHTQASKGREWRQKRKNRAFLLIIRSPTTKITGNMP